MGIVEFASEPIFQEETSHKLKMVVMDSCSTVAQYGTPLCCGTVVH
jgi:hypothetical protein